MAMDLVLVLILFNTSMIPHNSYPNSFNCPNVYSECDQFNEWLSLAAAALQLTPATINSRFGSSRLAPEQGAATQQSSSS